MIRTVGDMRRALQEFDDMDIFVLVRETEKHYLTYEADEFLPPLAIGARARLVIEKCDKRAKRSKSL